MFDLQTGVHLKKVKILCAVDDKFHSPRAGIPHRLRQCTGLLTHGLAHFGGEEWARGLFNHLLIAPLNRTLALIEINAIAMAISQDLNLNMARLGDEFLNKNPVIAKTAGRFILG